MDIETTEVVDTPKVNRLKKLVANRKVQLGAALAITAVVSACIARSSAFASGEFSMDEVVDIVNDVLEDNKS